MLFYIVLTLFIAMCIFSVGYRFDLEFTQSFFCFKRILLRRKYTKFFIGKYATINNFALFTQIIGYIFLVIASIINLYCYIKGYNNSTPYNLLYGKVILRMFYVIAIYAVVILLLYKICEKCGVK